MTAKQGEIWQVNLDPTIRTEINKKRPCLVIGDDDIGILPSKTILPITSWDDKYSRVPWMIKCNPTKLNNLTKTSSIDTFQIRNLSTRRFIKKTGIMESELLFEAHETVVKTLSVKYRLVVG